MERFECEKLAKTLMLEHGLINWTFKFDNAKRRYGQCSYRKKQISLSNHFVDSYVPSESDIKDVILHEIAHALTPKHGHDKVWKAKALEIGCDGKRVSHIRLEVYHRYQLSCGGNCEWVIQRHRKPRKGSTCKGCKGNIIVLDLDKGTEEFLC